MLEVEDLHTYYGRAHILSGVDLEVGRGEVVVLLGRNGAGKSTTLKSIMGLVRPARGTLRFDGHRLVGMAVHAVCRLGLGYVPEDRRIFKHLSVAENLEVGRQPPREGAPTWTLERVFELFPNLGEMRARLAGRISGGEQQMLTVARTLMGNPALMLLDEPSEGLAPVIVEQMGRTVVALKREGLSVLLSEQNLHFASFTSDRAYIMEKGRIRYHGSMKELEANEEVRNTYLSV